MARRNTKAKAKKLPCDIWPVNDGMEEEEFPGDLDYDEVLDRIDDLTRAAKIGIPSYENPQYACFAEDGTVLGVVTGGIAGDHEFQPEDGTPAYDYRFSVVVSPKARRKGIARTLVKKAEAAAKEEADAREAYIYLEAWVVNPHMAVLLESMGYEGDWSEDEPMMGKYI